MPTIINKSRIVQILRSVYLFQDFQPSEVELIIEEGEVAEFEADSPIINEDDIGKEMYVVLSGNLSVFSICDDGTRIELKEISVGDFFGEQALLPGKPDTRTASVTALSPVELFIIPKSVFQDSILKHGLLINDLEKLGQDYVRQKLAQTSVLFRSIALDHGISQWIKEKVFDVGEIIFNENDESDDFYLVMQGEAEIFTERDGMHDTLMYVREGGYFGELAPIRKEKRRASVRASTQLRVLVLKGEKFSDLYRQHPELRSHFSQIKAVYNLPDRGIVTLHSATFLDMPATSTIFHAENGIELVVTKVIGKSIVSIGKVKPVSMNSAQELVFDDPIHGIFRKIDTSSGKVVGAVCHGSWDDLGYLLELCLKGEVLSARQYSLFRLQGELRLEREEYGLDGDPVICKCAQVKKSQIKKQIAQGYCTVEDIGEETGASNICGSCTPLVSELIGRSEFLPAKLTQIKSVSKDVCSFVFEPIKGFISHHQVGQHIDIETEIEGERVRRSYTLTSPIDDSNKLEITVKRQKEGRFSNWMHDVASESNVFRISRPKGGFNIAEKSNKPIVFLAGGIGVTPALSYLRSYNGIMKRKVMLYLSAGSADSVACLSEILDLEKNNENLHVELFLSQGSRRLANEDMKALAQRYPNAEYFICGPEKYETFVLNNLQRLSVPDKHIQTESFIPKEHDAPVVQRGHKASIIVTQYALIACALLLMVPAIVAYSNGQTPSIFETLITDKILRQVTGYSLVGVVAIGLLMSVRKRLVRVARGRFSRWRLFHLMMSALALGGLIFHTGFSLGNNLNGWLMLSFLGISVVGSALMISKYRQRYRPGPNIQALHERLNWAHIAISAFLPSLVVAHVVAGYYF